MRSTLSFLAVTRKRAILTAAVIGLAFALGGCGTVDKILFGDDEPASPPPASATAGTASAPETAGPPRATFDSPEGSGSAVQTSAPPTADNGPPPSMAAPAPPPPSNAYVSAPARVGVTPIAVDPGSNTGTTVNATIQQLRGQLSGLEVKLGNGAQRLSDLRASNASATAAYLDAKTRITTQLQLGTTRGNPDLVARWNSGQSALDQMSSNINATNALSSEVQSSIASAQALLQSIAATDAMPGGVDEDHRQLGTLEDETNQTLIVQARLLKDCTEDLRRQTAFVANERVSLAALAAGIKQGEIGGSGVTATPAGAPSVSQTEPASGGALYVVEGNRKGDYQRPLYAALNKALQDNSAATFEIAAVSPTHGSAATIQSGQTALRRRAQDVMRTITAMGVPASRITLTSSTDPALTNGEVRIFAR